MKEYDIEYLEGQIKEFRRVYPPKYYNNRSYSSTYSNHWFTAEKAGLVEYINSNIPHISVEKAVTTGFLIIRFKHD